MPDTIVTLFDGISLAEELNNLLDQFDFTFLFKRENDEKMLSTKGCLVVDEKMAVIDYEDKPSQKSHGLAKLWFCFKKEAFDNCMSFMEQSTLNLIQKRTKIYDTKIYRAKLLR